MPDEIKPIVSVSDTVKALAAKVRLYQEHAAKALDLLPNPRTKDELTAQLTLHCISNPAFEPVSDGLRWKRVESSRLDETVDAYGNRLGTGMRVALSDFEDHDGKGPFYYGNWIVSGIFGNLLVLFSLDREDNAYVPANADAVRITHRGPPAAAITRDGYVVFTGMDIYASGPAPKPDRVQNMRLDPQGNRILITLPSGTEIFPGPQWFISADAARQDYLSRKAYAEQKIEAGESAADARKESRA